MNSGCLWLVSLLALAALLVALIALSNSSIQDRFLLETRLSSLEQRIQSLETHLPQRKPWDPP